MHPANCIVIVNRAYCRVHCVSTQPTKTCIPSGGAFAFDTSACAKRHTFLHTPECGVGRRFPCGTACTDNALADAPNASTHDALHFHCLLPHGRHGFGSFFLVLPRESVGCPCAKPSIFHPGRSGHSQQVHPHTHLGWPLPAEAALSAGASTRNKMFIKALALLALEQVPTKHTG